MSHKDAPPLTAEQAKFEQWVRDSRIEVGLGRTKSGAYLARYATELHGAYQQGYIDALAWARAEVDSRMPPATPNGEAPSPADDARAMLAELLDCPYVVDEASNPPVGALSVAFARIQKARAILRATVQPAATPEPDPWCPDCAICHPEGAHEPLPPEATGQTPGGQS